MNLITAILAYIAAGLNLYNGISDSSWLTLLLAAMWMAVGNYNIKQYKQHK